MNSEKVIRRRNSTSNFNMERSEKRDRKLSKTGAFILKIIGEIKRHVFLERITNLILIILSIYFLFMAVFSFYRNIGADYYIELAKDFIFVPEEKIDSTNGRINILILGKGGGKHVAPDLTDTLIFASISMEDASISLISIPRDLWISELRTKLNSVYYWGNQKEDSGGIVLAKSVIEKIVGQRVHYAVVVDFEIFTSLIDTLGGVEVNVKTGFIDEHFPIPGLENDDCNGDTDYKCRYETVEYKPGLQVMDGKKALKFVRSRNAEGDEGTDIARAERQRLVLSALKEKVTQRKVLTSPRIIFDVWNIVSSSLETDIDPPAGAILARLGYEAKKNLNSTVLPEELLNQPRPSARYDNLYVFVPRAGDDSKISKWTKIHKWVECVLIEKDAKKVCQQENVN